MDRNKLYEDRLSAANDEYQNYDFGLEVENENGWDYVNPCHEWTCVVFVLNPENLTGDTSTVNFHVAFVSDDSAEVKEVYALDSKSGNLLGQRG